ncbi:YceK/YidQ family lipoprotein [Methylosarcina fibrata]|uniref:YceK/YidQ family lipoprotein n=1 Tax=Methylosarcina fibrata TaxID=105972 RepID=UPI00036A236E|nr:YceK/YidQ family lipoprotein [Methylosarcina fibrata]
MKFNIQRWAVVILASSLAVGCSSIRARTEERDANQWTVYPGVRLDVAEMGKLTGGEPLPSSGANSSGPGWVKGMIGTILVFDLPFSGVFDTLVIPYDLYRIYHPEDFGDADSGSGDSSRYR